MVHRADVLKDRTWALNGPRLRSDEISCTTSNYGILRASGKTWRRLMFGPYCHAGVGAPIVQKTTRASDTDRAPGSHRRRSALRAGPEATATDLRPDPEKVTGRECDSLQWCAMST